MDFQTATTDRGSDLNAARRKSAIRRGADDLLITFDDSMASTVNGPEQLLALDDSMNALAKINPRQAFFETGEPRAPGLRGS